MEWEEEGSLQPVLEESAQKSSDEETETEASQSPAKDEDAGGIASSGLDADFQAEVAGDATTDDADESHSVAKLTRKITPIMLNYSCQANFSQGAVNDTVVNCCDTVSSTEKSTQATSFAVRTKDFQSQTIREKEDKESHLPFYAYDDKKFKAMCGVKKQFVSFVLGEMKVKKLQFTDSKLLSPESKLTLMFMKFRLNLPFTVLAAYHGMSEASAKRFFYESLDLMYEVAKTGVVWFDRATIQARMPSSFKALYPNVRAKIDCSEIETELPPQVRQKVLMYSSYKTRHTYKFLVGCAPSGEIMYISKGYGGRSTDTEITVDSGFLENIEAGDVVMSDKGFPHIEASLNEKGGVLVMPPFKRGNKQFTMQENQDGYRCASVRIHVERAIRRLKVFKIMKFVPQKMMSHGQSTGCNCSDYKFTSRSYC